MNLNSLYGKISSLLHTWSENDFESCNHFSLSHINDPETGDLASRTLACISEDASSDRRIRLVRNGQDLHPAQFYNSRIGDGLIQHTRLKHQVVNHILKDGGTVVVDHAHEVCNELRILKELIESHLGVTCWIQIYVTQSSESVFGMHSDDHPFIVFQLLGRKRWETQNKKASLSSRLFSPGSIAYFPRGYLHNVSGIGELSVHLTLAFDTPLRLGTNASITRHGNGLPYSLGVSVLPETRARLSLSHKSWTVDGDSLRIELDHAKIRVPLRFERILTLLITTPSVSASEASSFSQIPLEEVLNFWQKGFEAGLLFTPLI